MRYTNAGGLYTTSYRKKRDIVILVNGMDIRGTNVTDKDVVCYVIDASDCCGLIYTTTNTIGIRKNINERRFTIFSNWKSLFSTE